MTEFQVDTLFRQQVMDYQVNTIGKAIRLVFADLVTFNDTTSLT